MQYKKFPLTEMIQKRSRFLTVASEPTRMRILHFMFEYKKACVSDIAESLDLSIANVSQHLQLMRDNGFFTTERMGNHICYVLIDGVRMKILKQVLNRTNIDAQ